MRGRTMRASCSGNADRPRRADLAGFTLIELVLVVTLLGIIAAMAIPTLQNSRKYANEGSAIASLRMLNSAELCYRTRFGTFATLADLVGRQLIDENYADGQKSGFAFTSPAAPTKTNFTFSAQPTTPGVTGDRFFYIDETGVIRFRDGSVATSTDPPLQ